MKRILSLGYTLDNLYLRDILNGTLITSGNYGGFTSCTDTCLCMYLKYSDSLNVFMYISGNPFKKESKDVKAICRDYGIICNSLACNTRNCIEAFKYWVNTDSDEKYRIRMG